MKMVMKIATAAGLAGALALAAATPSQARHGHNAAAIGFGIGALAGAAAAGAAYNDGYYEPGYAYAPDYAYPEPVYGAYDYAPPYYRTVPPCATDMGYGRFSYESC